MIRAEVPLAAIGQVLRHHDPLTTTNYARVDVERLRGLARPWPILGVATLSTSALSSVSGGIR